jgi:hypothetical protein
MTEQTSIVGLSQTSPMPPIAASLKAAGIKTSADTRKRLAGGQTALTLWNTGNSLLGKGGLRHRKAPVPTDESGEQWSIQVKGVCADDLWVSGDFINWRIPGLRMTRTSSCDWFIELRLTPGRYQFACYRYVPGNGVQRLADSTIAYFISGTRAG